MYEIDAHKSICRRFFFRESEAPTRRLILQMHPESSKSIHIHSTPPPSQHRLPILGGWIDKIVIEMEYYSIDHIVHIILILLTTFTLPPTSSSPCVLFSSSKHLKIIYSEGVFIIVNSCDKFLAVYTNIRIYRSKWMKVLDGKWFDSNLGEPSIY